MNVSYIFHVGEECFVVRSPVRDVQVEVGNCPGFVNGVSHMLHDGVHVSGAVVGDNLVEDVVLEYFQVEISGRRCFR